MSVACHRGSLADVRSRFVAVGQERNAAIVVRVTADNPLTQPLFIDALVRALQADHSAAYAMMDKDRVPDGSQAEAFRMQALMDTLVADATDYSREHVTPALRRGNGVLVVEPPPELELADYFVGIDTFPHYLHVNQLFDRYGDDENLLRRVIADVRQRRSSERAAPAGSQ